MKTTVLLIIAHCTGKSRADNYSKYSGSKLKCLCSAYLSYIICMSCLTTKSKTVTACLMFWWSGYSMTQWSAKSCFNTQKFCKELILEKRAVILDLVWQQVLQCLGRHETRWIISTKQEQLCYKISGSLIESQSLWCINMRSLLQLPRCISDTVCAMLTESWRLQD